jgi:hypothetical protein
MAEMVAPAADTTPPAKDSLPCSAISYQAIRCGSSPPDTQRTSAMVLNVMGSSFRLAIPGERVTATWLPTSGAIDHD